MIYMLFDNPKDKQKMTFLKNYETASILQVFPSRKCCSINEMLVFCNDHIKKTTNADIIICWYDFMAILCWWLCKLQLKKRRIVALNILLKNKTTVKNKLTKLLYRAALKSNMIQATVTSREYGKHLNEMLRIHKDYIILHDTYHVGYSIEYHGQVAPNTVFCGGRNGRDWKFLIEIARAMPEITFHCVMPRDEFEQYKEYFSSNMVIKSEVSEKEFLEFLCQSQLVVMPLDTEAPAGLICFYQAAANGKMIITTNTVTTREYFAGGRGVLCENNLESWKEKIHYYLKHTEEAGDCIEKFKCFLEEECSEEVYAKILWRILAE